MIKRLLILAVCLAAVLFLFPGTARAEQLQEYQVKAALLYNFTQFVQWPDKAFGSAAEPFVVATVGEDPFGGELERAMEEKSVAGHAVVVKHFASAGELGKCHLLFVPKSEDSRLSAIFDAVGDKPVLTIGDTDAFPWAGGTIRFFLDQDRIRFEINTDSADKAALKISSKLLKLARIFKK